VLVRFRPEAERHAGGSKTAHACARGGISPRADIATISAASTTQLIRRGTAHLDRRVLKLIRPGSSSVMEKKRRSRRRRGPARALNRAAVENLLHVWTVWTRRTPLGVLVRYGTTSGHVRHRSGVQAGEQRVRTVRAAWLELHPEKRDSDLRADARLRLSRLSPAQAHESGRSGRGPPPGVLPPALAISARQHRVAPRREALHARAVCHRTCSADHRQLNPVLALGAVLPHR